GSSAKATSFPCLPLGTRHVGVALLDNNVLAPLEITHDHRAALDRDLRAVAAVLRQPLGAANRRRCATSLGAEATLAVAPQAAHLLLFGRRRRLLGLDAAVERAAQRELGDRLGPAGLRDDEGAEVEVRGLDLTDRSGRRGEPHAALRRV